MNFFIKVLDDINLEKASGYTAWYIERIMTHYSASRVRAMWSVVAET